MCYPERPKDLDSGALDKPHFLLPGAVIRASLSESGALFQPGDLPMAKPSTLTDVAIRNLRPADQRYEIWDSKVTCLGVRVSQSGTKTFVVL